MTSTWTGSRRRRRRSRLAQDPHVLLSAAIVTVGSIIAFTPRTDVLLVLGPPAGILVVQCLLVLRGGIRAPAVDTVRLLLSLAALFWLSLATGDPESLPLLMLCVPVVVLAAARGAGRAILVGAIATVGALGLVAVLLPPGGASPGVIHRAVAVIATMLLLSFGARRTVASLERAVAHARASVASERRRLRQLSALESIGRVLATKGATAEALDEVVGLLADRFDYRFVSIYTRDGPVMRLGAQRGYDEFIETFDGTSGVVGRVMGTRQPTLVRDVRDDPDYRAASPDVRTEVTVPLLVDDELIGVLNAESGLDDRPLDQTDLNTMTVVADRIAASMALAAERKALLERAALFSRLAAFGSAINASLDQPTAHSAIVRAVAGALDTGIVTLFLRDPATREDRIAAIHGGDEHYIGIRLMPGEGLTGRAIAERRVVSSETVYRDQFPSTIQGAAIPDAVTAASAPLIHENEVIGAIALARLDLARPYTRLELDALPLVASQVALALSNVSLHARVAEAAIRDPLTGLWNRRHLEVSAGRLFAARARLDPELRHPVAAILFDLDHFGQFNKRHGHLVGDAVLRAFGTILASRLRSSDIVARFGGEEFVAILDGASAAEAQRVADEIRQELETARIPGADGLELKATVSAGCASLGPAVTSLESLLEIADVALQMAKRGGRNQVVAA